MVTPDEKRAALSKAIKAHRKYMVDVVNGKDCDRHLLGLKVLALEEIAQDPNKKLHPFFDDFAFRESSHWKLSTSNVPTKFNIGGFGPVVEGGYGVCYQPFKDRIHFQISAWKHYKKNSVSRLGKCLEQALNDMVGLYAKNAKL